VDSNDLKLLHEKIDLYRDNRELLLSHIKNLDSRFNEFKDIPLQDYGGYEPQLLNRQWNSFKKGGKIQCRYAIEDILFYLDGYDSYISIIVTKREMLNPNDFDTDKRLATFLSPKVYCDVFLSSKINHGVLAAWMSNRKNGAFNDYINENRKYKYKGMAIIFTLYIIE